MIVYYRDEGGIVAEEVASGSADVQVDFCAGYAYFTSAAVDEDGFLIERKVPVNELIRIER